MERHVRERRRTWTLDDCLCPLIKVWTVVQAGIILAEFLGPIYQYLRVATPRQMPFAYFSLIILWAVRDEVRKRLGRVRHHRKGEIYLSIWWVFLLLLFVAQALTNGYLKVSMSALETVLLVSAAYCGTTIHRFFLKRWLVKH